MSTKSERGGRAFVVGTSINSPTSRQLGSRPHREKEYQHNATIAWNLPHGACPATEASNCGNTPTQTRHTNTRQQQQGQQQVAKTKGKKKHTSRTSGIVRIELVQMSRGLGNALKTNTTLTVLDRHSEQQDHKQTQESKASTMACGVNCHSHED